jgi:catechol 2,3-dioxygenase-like lactoylglutathione lyase family enzyme
VPKLIHTCYRVLDLDRSIGFYEKLGLEEIGRIPRMGAHGAVR